MPSVLFLACALLTPTLHILADASAWGSIKQRLANLEQFEDATLKTIASSGKRARLIHAKYSTLFAFLKNRETLAKTSGSDLDLLYRAASLSAFYSRAKTDVADMKSIFQELRTRKLLEKRHYVHLYEALVSTRQFMQARELASKNPHLGLPLLPRYREAPQIKPGSPTELVLSADKKTWLRTTVDLQQDSQIVVVSHPLCHFCQYAIRDIEADSVLRGLFARHALWIAPQDGNLDLDDFQEWETQHPNATIRVAYKQSEWPMIDTWNTPSFYFLAHGKVVAKVVGWPKEGHKAELIAASRTAGLLPSSGISDVKHADTHRQNF